MDFPLYLIVLSPLLGAAFNLLVGRSLDKRVAQVVGCAAVGASFLVAAYAVVVLVYPEWQRAQITPGHTYQPVKSLVYSWISSGTLSLGQVGGVVPLEVNIAFTMDTLAAV